MPKRGNLAKPKSLSGIIRATQIDSSTSGLSPAAMLLLLLMKHTDRNGITEDHLSELFNKAVFAAGSIGAAIEALENGRMRLHKFPDGGTP